MDYKSLFHQGYAIQAILTEEIGNISKRIKVQESKLKNIQMAQVFIQTVAKETQENLQVHIQDLVQSALDTCFPGEFDFFVEFEIKRGKTEANLFLESEGCKVDPMDSTGGGVIDIISFALRLSAWSLSQTEPVILMDEPFKFLSVNLRPLAGLILKSLCDKLKLQIIMVSHDPAMIEVSDRVFEVKQKKGRSYIEETN